MIDDRDAEIARLKDIVRDLERKRDCRCVRVETVPSAAGWSVIVTAPTSESEGRVAMYTMAALSTMHLVAAQTAMKTLFPDMSAEDAFEAWMESMRQQS